MPTPSKDVLIEAPKDFDEFNRFLRAMVHDLRNTLQAMHITSKVLENQQAVQSEQKLLDLVNRLNNMKEEADRILRDVSTYRRAQFDPLNLELIDLNVFLREIPADELWRENDEMIIEHPLPTVWCDRTLLELIFTALIRNALQYNNQPTRQIRIACEPETVSSAFWQVSVADNGIGIGIEDVEQVFEPFKRFASGGEPGSGMGLFIARQAAERFGGGIAVQSTVGQGSRFTVQIPKQRSEQNFGAS